MDWDWRRFDAGRDGRGGKWVRQWVIQWYIVLQI
jgi:hypothetical protein